MAEISLANLGRVRRPGASYNTPLSQLDEFAFRNWIAQNGVPFNADAKGDQDYDMRGFYQGLQQQNPMAVSSVNQNDGQMHYPDYWKTPLHQTFSADSQWAGPNAPQWIEGDRLATLGGRILFDERRQPSLADLVFGGR